MHILTLLPLLLTTNLNAQTYQDKHKKCSEAFNLNGEIDSTYFSRLKQRDTCMVGAPAPNFTAKSTEGKEIELAQLKGKVVVLNFWFTRCEPCIAEMPDLNKLVTHYPGKDVAFISFAPEDPATLNAFFKKHPFAFTAIPQGDNIRRDAFKLFSVWPYSIVIDREGRISKMWFGNPYMGNGTNVFDFYKEAIDKLL